MIARMLLDRFLHEPFPIELVVDQLDNDFIASLLLLR
jgi:hypothetical protein